MRKLSLLAVSLAAALSGCAVVIVPDEGVSMHTVWDDDSVQGNGQLSSEARPVAALSGLEVSGPMMVDVRVGPTPSLSIEGDANLLPLVHTEAAGDTLRVWVEKSVHPTNKLRVHYTTGQLQRLKTAGSGSVQVQGLNGAPLWLKATGSGQTTVSGQAARLDAELTGSGSVDANALRAGDAVLELTGSGRVALGQLTGGALRVTVKGSGSIYTNGTASHAEVRLRGSGNANLSGLTANSADLASTGSGDITVHVNAALQADATGSGTITVYGNPAQRSVSGKNVSIVN